MPVMWGGKENLFFDYIYRLSGSKIPAFRLWTSAALTADAIKREFQKIETYRRFQRTTFSCKGKVYC